MAHVGPVHAGSQTHAAGEPVHRPFREQSESVEHSAPGDGGGGGGGGGALLTELSAEGWDEAVRWLSQRSHPRGTG